MLSLIRSISIMVAGQHFTLLCTLLLFASLMSLYSNFPLFSITSNASFTENQALHKDIHSLSFYGDLYFSAGWRQAIRFASALRRIRRKAFTKAKFDYYPKSTSTQSLRILALSGDIKLNPGDVVGRTEEKKTNSKLKHRSTVTIAHLNIQSLKNRDHYILAKDLVLKHKLDIFTISESWLDDTVTDLEVQFPGYTLFRLDRSQRNGGGVCAFINSNF